MEKLMAILKYMNRLLNAVIFGMIITAIGIFVYDKYATTNLEATQIENIDNPKKAFLPIFLSRLYPYSSQDEIEKPSLAVRVYPEHEMKELAERRANEALIHPLIIEAMIEQESNWEQFAIGDGRDSRGLMQVQYKHHKDLCELKEANELLDADTNITCGIKVLKHYYQKQHGNRLERLKKAIKQYNGSGPQSEKYKNEVMAKLNKLLLDSLWIG